MGHLYHGSGYNQPELKPGFLHSGEVVKWDHTESNEWLYATTMMEEAIAQGFASVVEKHYRLARYKSHGSEIVIVCDGPLPRKEDLMKLDVFLYKIDWAVEMWQRVDNLHNGMNNEFKTKHIIPATMIDSTTRIDLKHWLGKKTVSITSNRAAMNW